jgi:hypothetical protein
MRRGCRAKECPGQRAETVNNSSNILVMNHTNNRRSNDKQTNPKGTKTMKRKTNRIVTDAGLGLLVLTACVSTAWAAATKTPVAGQETTIALLAAPPPEITPSGIVHIQGQVTLAYDDMDDNRLNGYNTIVLNATIDADGNLIRAGGTLTVREKLDAIPIEDLLSGNFDLADIEQGDILWEGVWSWNPRTQDVITGVVRNSEGLKFFWTILPRPDGRLTGYILDPHGE